MVAWKSYKEPKQKVTNDNLQHSRINEGYGTNTRNISNAAVNVN